MLTPDWTFFPQLAVFLLTVAMLNLVLFRPVRKVLDERNKGTVDTSSEADDLQAEAQRLEADYEARMRAARDKAAAERARLRTEGQAEAVKLADQGRQQAEEVTKQLTSEISKDLETARGQLKAQASALSDTMVEHLLKASA